jgi:hypothetical protein
LFTKHTNQPRETFVLADQHLLSACPSTAHSRHRISVMPSSPRPVEDSQPPPQKRVKFAPLHDDVSRATEIQPHPLRIKPSGNALGATTNLRDTSTGLFCIFPDELILQVFGYLGSEDLVSLGKTSKGMYGFSRAEELWKQLFIEYVDQYKPVIISNQLLNNVYKP